MKKHIFATIVLLFLSSGVLAQQESAIGNILFILDGSGSMWGQIEGKHKIVIAKEVMTGLVQELPADIRVGLQVYGHRNKGDCQDIEILVPVGSDNHQALIQQIEAIKPRGKTPITQSFQQAADQLRSLEDETTVILVSDGKETCEGDPCTLVRELREQGTKIKVHVVGFDVTEDESEQLVCIAEAGGGKYFSANNTVQLQEALKDVKQEVVAKADPRLARCETYAQAALEHARSNAANECGLSGERWSSDYAIHYAWCMEQGVNSELPDSVNNERTVALEDCAAKVSKVKAPEPPNKRIVKLGKRLGRISLPDATVSVDIINPETEAMAGKWWPHIKKPVEVPEGAYTLKWRYFQLDGIEVKAGEDLVTDAKTLGIATISLPDATESVNIINPQTEAMVGRWWRHIKKPVEVPAGTYTLKWQYFQLDGIEVKAGENLVADTKTLGIGTISLPDATESVNVINPQTEAMVGRWWRHIKKPVEVPAGTYTLKWQYFQLDGIEVKAGENLVADTKTLGIGTISLPDATESVNVINPQTEAMVGRWWRHIKKPVEVPAGTYTLKFPKFESGPIDVQAGEEVIIE